MDIFLDGEGPVYQQVARALKNAITGGRLTEGERLPPTRELCRELGICRTTAVNAYALLQTEGYVRAITGSGSYVTWSGFAKKSDAQQLSAIPAQNEKSRITRSVLDLHNLPGIPSPGLKYSFEGAQPVLNSSIKTIWANEIRKAVHKMDNRYPGPHGRLELRRELAHYIERSRGIACEADDIIIVSGVQQAIQICIQALMNVGDGVAFEEPGYSTARNLFTIAGAKVYPVAVDRDGIRVSDIPPGMQMIYVTPSHQFPTGALLSQARRTELLEYAQRTGAWVIEDDYDGESRINSPALLSLHSSDRGGRTIYVGTFSKSFSAGIRLGYIVAPPAIRQDLLGAKWCLDFGSPALEQVALAGLLRSGAYAKHLRWASEELLTRRTVLSSELMARFGTAVRFGFARSGMHVLAWFDELGPEAGATLTRRCHQEGLGIFTVEHCYVHRPRSLGLLLGFSSMSVPAIREAVTILERNLSPLLRATRNNGMDTENVVTFRQARG